MNSFPLVIVDLETTGARPSFDRIIDVAVLRVEGGKLVSTYQTLINPERPLQPHITRLTGITDDLLRTAPTFADIKNELADQLRDAVFVAHNARFDYGFLKNEFLRLDTRFSARCLCTVRLSRRLFPEHPRHHLDAVIERLGLQCSHRHRAWDDADVLWQFLSKMQCERPSQLTEAIAHVLKRPTLPPQIDPELIRRLPNGPGVYLFYGSEGSSLYVGKSVRIRNRVLSHFAGDHGTSKQMAMCQQIADIRAVSTAGELGALLLESHLIKELTPLYNRVARRRKQLVVLKKTTTAAGYDTVEIERLTQLHADELPATLGIFKSLKQAKDLMRETAKRYRLCPKLLGLEKGAGSCFYYHLSQCNGACLAKESALIYNIRFLQAFSAHKIKTWPFRGPVMIEERTAHAAQSDVFFVDQWCLIGGLRSNEYGQDPLMTGTPCFDYDSYKILLPYLLLPKKALRIKPITHAELQAATGRNNGE